MRAYDIQRSGYNTIRDSFWEIEIYMYDIKLKLGGKMFRKSH